MQRKTFIKKLLITFSALALLIVCSIVLCNTPAKLEHREKSFINSCEKTLKNTIYSDIFINGSSIRRGQQMSSPVSKLFEQRKDLEQIDTTDNGSVIFILSWSKEYIAEGSIHLIYQQDDLLNSNMVPLDFLQQDWILSTSENEISYNGGGSDGRGYIRITRIKPCWFRLEQYFPT